MATTAPQLTVKNMSAPSRTGSFTSDQKRRLRVDDTFMDGLSHIDESGATIGRGAPIQGIPKFADPHDGRKWVLERMAGAFRIMARKGYIEGTAGHISVRDPVDPDTFWINPYVDRVCSCELACGRC